MLINQISDTRANVIFKLDKCLKINDKILDVHSMCLCGYIRLRNCEVYQDL